MTMLEDTLTKQTDRIAEIMKFSTPEQERELKDIILANLKRSMMRQKVTGKETVIDAREARLYQFAVALKSSKNEKDFRDKIMKAIPESRPGFYKEMILRYNKMFFDTIQYPFPINKITEKKEEKTVLLNERDANTLKMIFTEGVKELREELEAVKAELKELKNHYREHVHGPDGKAGVIKPI